METYNFDNYIKLHLTGKPAKYMKPAGDLETYQIFSSAKDIDIRVIDAIQSSRLLSSTDKIRHFVSSPHNRYFYSIPVQAPSGDYVGFVYRSVFCHDYASIYKPFEDRTKKVPYMFGFFSDFKNYDRHTICMPIVVCEGIKDALVLKKFYPYTLANNTSNLRDNIYVLSNITDKILLAYDNDATGNIEAPRDKKNLARLGCSVDILKYSSFKDAASYINHPKELLELRNQLKLKVKGLIKGVTLSV